MSDLRKLTYLHEQLGDDRFALLIDSENTGKVKEFCDQILKDAIPTSFTIGDRTYDILGFLKGDEESVVGHTMVARAKEMSANLGKEDGEHILKHQHEIPVTFRGKVELVFPNWRLPDDSKCVYYVLWVGDRWDKYWHLLDIHWSDRHRFLRPK